MVSMAGTVLRLAVFFTGLLYVLWTLNAALKTFVLPRAAPVFLTGLVFRLTRALFWPWTHSARSYADRDRVMALYAPLSLLLLPVVWLVCVASGYTLMFWSAQPGSLMDAFKLSGSSLLTLGFSDVDSMATILLAFSEATLGLGLVALLIAYLPTMYTAFSRRERAVAKLEVRAGSPPTATEMIARAGRLRDLNYLNDEWEQWEDWFTELEESHTSLAALVFFRAPQPERSWVTAAGTVLDAAALMDSTVAAPPDPRASLCIRAGYIALRRIAGFFGVDYDPRPAPDDPISISREEFDAACETMESQGVPLRSDRDQAWNDFAGWRVNYDTVLIALAALTMAPYAPWSSDRSHRIGTRSKSRVRAAWYGLLRALSRS